MTSRSRRRCATGGNKLWKAIEEAGLLLALLDGKTDIDPESEEFARLVSADEVYRQ